jgi:signal transduction histidine kinase
MRIAKKIHDTVGYVFINIIMLLQAALAIIDKDRQKAEIKIGDALDYTRRGMNEIRYILRDIRSYEKPSLGLQNELHDIARLFAKATGVTVNMSYGNWRKSFGTKLDDFFISFLQESFTNALKHGCATVVDMNCWETNREIIIYVQDNGKGTPENLTMGIGISSIKEFVEAQKGHVDIRPSGSGFMIRVTLPLSAIDADDIPEDSRGNFSDVLSSSGIDRPL